MIDPALLVAGSGAGLLAVAIAAGAALRGWSGWLALKRLEIAGRGGDEPSPVHDLRERVRRLEAIASGVDR